MMEEMMGVILVISVAPSDQVAGVKLVCLWMMAIIVLEIAMVIM